MAQPNVVREPSMDEILASIRRIIESNEPVTSAGVATAFAEPEGFSGRPANDDAEEVTLTVDERFAGRDNGYAPAEPPVLRAVAETEMRAASAIVRDMRQPAPAAPQPVQPPQKSLSLADVAARVRAVSERGAAARDHAATVQQAAAAQPAPAALSPARVMEPEPVELETEEDAEIEIAQAEARLEVAKEIPKAEPASLISSSTGEQVARSFQDLAIALDNAERRSFDEIAEEMLRPMLQEWLDDNLPTLVERLVREEIERVARGPRR